MRFLGSPQGSDQDEFCCCVLASFLLTSSETKNEKPIVLSISKQISLLPIPQNQKSIIDAVAALAEAADKVSSKLASEEPWEFRESEAHNTSGDVQTEQDEVSHAVFEAALKSCSSVGNLVSEEADGIVPLGSGKLSVSLDPFDGSKAYEFGIPPGTIFGIFDTGDKPDQFSGDRVLAAGVFIYRHSLELVLAIGDNVYRISASSSQKLEGLTSRRVLICANLSNMSNWSKGWCDYIADRLLLQTDQGKHNMRWYGSLAAHFGAVIRTGGLFAYPPDSRPGYGKGHLRLVYEAIPISYIIVALGGRAIDGTKDILSLVPSDFHQKTPFAFGEALMISELEASIQKGQQ